MTTMELQAKRLTIIEAIKSFDEEKLSMVESLIKKLSKEEEVKAYKMPPSLLIALAEKAEEDFANGNYLTTNQLREEIKTWHIR